jgi:hypothetical protein
MKVLREIPKTEYDADRDASTVPEVEDDTEVLFIARFWASREQVAVQALVSVYGLEDHEIDFQQVSDDGEPIGVPYEAPIDESGIIGALILRDGRVLHVQEGYLLQCGDSLDDEFAALIAEQERQLVPVHVTVGGAAGDQARRELHGLQN